MARIRNGILGGFRGKVGNVIGQCYDGVETMRAYPSSVANPRTTSQVEHRELFKQMATIMSGANVVLSRSKEAKNRVNNGFNQALSWNFANAIEQGSINLEKLTFGTFWGGELDDFQYNVVQDDNRISCELTWDYQSDTFNSFADDNLIFLSLLTLQDKPTIVATCGFLTETREDKAARVHIKLDTALGANDRLDFYIGVNSVGAWRNCYGHNPQKPKEIINIPAKVDNPYDPNYAKWGKYYYNRPHWFTNIVGGS